MCGIAGIYERVDRRASRELLLEMASELQHRGPDGVGLYLDRGFGMVNTRLSIIDLAGGDQPLSNEDGRLWVMQNGEIFNHVELHAELEGRGHRFATRSDTEVIVHAYEEWGKDCVHHFIGEFAFAVWDRERSELFLARDRLGIRPLFVTEIDGAYLFASEAKALLRHKAARRELDPLALVETFQLWANAPDRSAFLGIRELPPGHHATLRADGSQKEHCYWDVQFAVPEAQLQGSVEELSEQVYELLFDATRLRLRADVPVGAYLSGGLDSSATAAIARRLTSQTLHSFGVRFTDPLFDEGVYQTQMAEALQTDLSCIEVDGAAIAEVFPRVIHLCEKPLLRTAPSPLLLLSRLVRESGFKVVLTGEGADEVFAGYQIFQEDKVRRFWARQPNSILRPRLLGGLYPYLARDLERGGGMTKAFFGKHLTETDDPLYSHRIRFENTARCLRFVSPDVLQRAAQLGDPEQRLLARLPADYSSFSPLARAQYLEIKTFLQGYLLHSQGDRMLMGNSVEGRFPFLDHRMFALAGQLPDSMRMRGLQEKFILRRAVSRLLPETIAKRRKKPYRAPILRAFIGPSAPSYVAELLSQERIERAGLFVPAAVAALQRKCERSVDAGVSETEEMALVGVLSSMLLHEQFVARPSLAAPIKATKFVVGASPEVV